MTAVGMSCRRCSSHLGHSRSAKRNTQQSSSVTKVDSAFLVTQLGIFIGGNHRNYPGITQVLPHETMIFWRNSLVIHSSTASEALYEEVCRHFLATVSPDATVREAVPLSIGKYTKNGSFLDTQLMTVVYIYIYIIIYIIYYYIYICIISHYSY